MKIDSSPVSRNNLAVCRFRQGDPSDALRILKVNLEANAPNPFTHALAAQAAAALGRAKSAEECLNRAISDFELGIEIFLSEGLPLAKSWCEYTVLIQRAAGDLGHHHLVLDLYHKWKEYHVNPENQFLAGVASFNLGHFRKAISLWKSLVQSGWEFANLYVIVAEEEGESIKAILDGRKVQLVIQTPRIIEGRDEALEKLVREARSLRDSGKSDEAIEKLQSLIVENTSYPPAMLTLANLLRMKDRLDEAEDLLTMLIDIFPDHPIVRANLAGLYIQ